MIRDAIGVVTQGLAFDKLVELVDTKEKAKEIWETAKLVRLYLQFKSALSMGLTVGLNDLPFERAMVFSWIEEAKNVRKT
jgi:hypothetical protein